MLTDIALLACAKAAHAANRAYCEAIGDPVMPDWQNAPDWHISSLMQGVVSVLKGNGPEKNHESWLEARRADGWKYGPVKDEGKKEHPCLVAYASLPPTQQVKDLIFVEVVQAMARAFGWAAP